MNYVFFYLRIIIKDSFISLVSHIGRYKGRTVQTTDLHTSDWYKRRTHTHLALQRTDSTNHGLTHFGLVQTSDWNKRRTGTNVELRQTSDQYKRQTGT